MALLKEDGSLNIEWINSLSSDKSVIMPQNIAIDKDGNWVAANGGGADFIPESIDNNIKIQ